MNTENLHTRLNQETARIHWHELQRFFASGNMVQVDASLDLIVVATAIAEDDSQAVSAWMDSAKVAPVTDQQASLWHQEQVALWAVVVKPWILVQYKP